MESFCRDIVKYRRDSEPREVRSQKGSIYSPAFKVRRRECLVIQVHITVELFGRFTPHVPRMGSD